MIIIIQNDAMWCTIYRFMLPTVVDEDLRQISRCWFRARLVSITSSLPQTGHTVVMPTLAGLPVSAPLSVSLFLHFLDWGGAEVSCKELPLCCAIDKLSVQTPPLLSSMTIGHSEVVGVATLKSSFLCLLLCPAEADRFPATPQINLPGGTATTLLSWIATELQLDDPWTDGFDWKKWRIVTGGFSALDRAFLLMGVSDSAKRSLKTKGRQESLLSLSSLAYGGKR